MRLNCIDAERIARPNTNIGRVDTANTYWEQRPNADSGFIRLGEKTILSHINPVWSGLACTVPQIESLAWIVL